MFFIILCCFRPRLDFLRLQIESIRAQTDGNFECLVQDDAGPPELGDQIRALVAGDSRFSFSRNDARLGVFHNFERGLRAVPAHAEYVCYSDQDDEWAPQKLARQREALQDHQVALCHTDLELMDADGRTTHASCFEYEGRNLDDYSLPQLILRNSVTGCTTAFRAALIPHLLPFPHQGVHPRFHHDHWTVLHATMHGRVVALREPLVRYRQHGGNVLGASAGSRMRPAFAHLRAVLRSPQKHLSSVEREWTLRREWIDLLIARAPATPRPDARLRVLADWTHRSGALLEFTAPHLFAKEHWLAEAAIPVLLGQVSDGARRTMDRIAPAIASPLQRLAAGDDWGRHRVLKPLGEPTRDREVCLFAHFDPDGRVDDYVLHHLARLREAGLQIVFVSTAVSLDVRDIEPLCAAIIERDNVGLDFGSWRTALRLYPQVMEARRLFFVNDSVYGPLRPLRPVIDRMAATGSDFWAITESGQTRSHFQSYFLAFERSCLESPAFEAFVKDILPLDDKDEIIRRYELGMKARLTAHGLRGAALVPAQPGELNPTMHGWRDIITAGAPYVKVQLLRDNPHHLEISSWPDVVSAHGYDWELIARHAQRPRGTNNMIEKSFRFWLKHGTRAAVDRATSRMSDVVGENPVDKVYRYWLDHGTGDTVRQTVDVLRSAVRNRGQSAQLHSSAASDVVERRFVTLQRLPTHAGPRGRRRLNMITDSINPPYLYGGVGTAMIFATLLAERLDRPLRIITRTDAPKPENLVNILKLAGMRPGANVELAYPPYGDPRETVELAGDELCITTSWWTTASMRRTLAPERIIYLLQEDERMFYPLGDDSLRCSELLSDPHISFLINTQLLFEHLVRSGLENVARNGIWFEPSFPESVFHPDPAPREKPRFMFYARPHNLRNLFFRGLEAINEAVASGVLRPDEWDIVFIGKDIPKGLTLAGDLPVQRYENLPWAAYAELVRKTDLGLSLMYTPHPSYPPLDLAASGAVVVTNRFVGTKHDLDQYSRNIICAEPTVGGLVQGIARGVELARDREKRRKNYQENRIGRDWRASFAGALDRFADRFR